MKNSIEKLQTNITEIELQPDEYIHESEHLIYCSRCHTPRQSRHIFSGKVFLPPVRCKCQQEIFEKGESESLIK